MQPKSSNDNHSTALQYMDEKDFDNAKKHFELTIDESIDHWGQRHNDVARAKNNLGVLYTQNKDYSSAEKCFEEAKSIFEENNNQSDLILLECNTVNIIFILEDSDSAELEALIDYEYLYQKSLELLPEEIIALIKANIDSIRKYLKDKGVEIPPSEILTTTPMSELAPEPIGSIRKYLEDKGVKIPPSEIFTTTPMSELTPEPMETLNLDLPPEIANIMDEILLAYEARNENLILTLGIELYALFAEKARNNDNSYSVNYKGVSFRGIKSKVDNEDFLGIIIEFTNLEEEGFQCTAILNFTNGIACLGSCTQWSGTRNRVSNGEYKTYYWDIDDDYWSKEKGMIVNGVYQGSVLKEKWHTNLYSASTYFYVDGYVQPVEGAEGYEINYAAGAMGPDSEPFTDIEIAIGIDPETGEHNRFMSKSGLNVNCEPHF